MAESTLVGRPERRKAPSFAASGKTRADYNQKLGEFLDLFYTKLGFSVIEIPYKAKIAAKSWKKYQRKRMEWKEVELLKDKTCNLAIVTGKLSGLTVIDVDGAEAWESLKAIGITYEDLKEAPHVRTGRQKDGYHFYYRYQEGDSSKANFLNKCDVRGDGGYVIAPPSIHSETNNAYEIIGTFPESAEDLPPMPPVIAKFTAKKQKSSKAGVKAKQSAMAPTLNTKMRYPMKEMRRRIVELIIPFWKPGVRHQISLSLAGYLRKQGAKKSFVDNIFTDIYETTLEGDLNDVLLAVETTYENDINDVVGISGMDHHVSKDAIWDLRKLYISDNYFMLQDVGYDKNSIYFYLGAPDDPKADRQVIAQLPFAYLYTKRTHRVSSVGFLVTYVFQMGDAILDVTSDDLADPKRRLFKKLQDACVGLKRTYIDKISDLINACVAELEYPTYDVYSYLSWKDDYFIVPKVNRENFVLADEASFPGWNEVHGEFEKQKSAYSPAVMHKFPVYYAVIGHTMISPLLEEIRKLGAPARIGILNLIGEKDSGKSTLTFGAYALFGNPERMKSTWMATETNIEMQLQKHSIFPVLFDEMSVGNDPKVMQRVVYMIEQGQGKGRSRWDRDSQDTADTKKKCWCLNVLSSGEDSLVEGGRQGLMGRVIELWVKHDSNLKLTNAVNRMIGRKDSTGERHTGWGLAKLQEYVVKHGREQTIKEVFDDFLRFQKVIEPHFKGEDKRHIQYWAGIAAGYSLLYRIFGGYRDKIDDEWFLEVSKNCWSHGTRSGNFINDPANFHETVVGYCMKNSHLFADCKDEYFSNNAGGFGYLGYTQRIDGGKFVFLEASNLRTISKQTGFDRYTLMVKQLVSYGIIREGKAKSEIGRGTCRVTCSGSTLRFYVIDTNVNKYEEVVERKRKAKEAFSE